jgi:hypothetical protein
MNSIVSFGCLGCSLAAKIMAAEDAAAAIAPGISVGEAIVETVAAVVEGRVGPGAKTSEPSKPTPGKASAPEVRSSKRRRRNTRRPPPAGEPPRCADKPEAISPIVQTATQTLFILASVRSSRFRCSADISMQSVDKRLNFGMGSGLCLVV